MPNRRTAAPASPANEVGTHLLLAVVLWVAVHLATGFAQAPPETEGSSASRAKFSGSVALGLAGRLNEGLGPRPTGSDSASEFRDRLVAELDDMGFSPEVRRHIVPATDTEPVAGVVHNVVARIYGREDWPPVLAIAHTDSVAAGPGMADDLAGVACLIEGVRTHLAKGLPRRGVILLFTDGEEDGLIGARAFVRDDPWFDEVGAVINFEARGASGPSRLFQTGPGSSELLQRYGENAARPSVSSVSSWVYDNMPNGTDLTVFIDAGLPGVNFAFIGDWPAYHTPLDALGRTSEDSVQHHGENLLAVLRGLEQGPLDPDPPLEGAYGDFFGRVTWALGRRTLRVLSILVLLGVTWGIGREMRRGPLRARGLLAALAVPLVALLFAAVLGLGTGRLAQLAEHMQRPWWAAGWAGRLALIGAAGLALGLTARLAGWKHRTNASQHIGWAVVFLWSVSALFSSLFVPAFAHLFLGGAAFAAAAALAPRLQAAPHVRFARIALYALPGAVLFWAPVQLGIDAAFGPDQTLMTILPFAWLGTWILPQLTTLSGPAWGTWMATGLLVWSGGLFGGAVTGARTEEAPGHLNLIYRVDESEAEGGAALLLANSSAGFLPETLAQVGGFGELRRGWAHSIAAPHAVDKPSFEVQQADDGGQGLGLVTGLLKPGVTGGIVRISVDTPFGCTFVLDGTRIATGQTCRIVGLPAEGLPLELRFAMPPNGPVEVLLGATNPGLPGHFARVQAARGISWVPYGRGDRTEIRGGRVLIEQP